MKKTLLILLIALGLASVSKASETPGVKLGELKNGKTIITYDKSKLHNALNYVLESEFLEIDSTEIFVEEGKYYLWAMIKDKASKMATGKFVFSMEKTEKNDLVLIAKPTYMMQCLLESGNCSTCIVNGSACSCYIGEGTCIWKKIPINGGGARLGYGKTFDELIRSQSAAASE